ncbi:GntR family transcriptional regulator [Paenibacillus protaetiae]|uniref:GntR family transcriptional regulator n=1 Tax=Paenibacillus protaetiae TaxID=2509456 RepID=A0A4V0YFB2_9BACL|nr:GntR family transcriptional regulator [Paenibacillus protaetiae]QAY67101.1 GntR family transcriptional regulator [Paenibacillus protaetiae]
MKEQIPPKYIQLKQEIMSWIAAREYKPHDRLPSENEIAAQFEMSRQTVRQALGDLEQEGRLYRVQGKGTFVSGHAPLPERSGDGAGGMTVGLITTHISDYIFPAIVRGVESTLRQQGAKLLLASTDNEKAKERESLASMLREPLTGLIIEPTKSAEGDTNFDLFLTLDAQQIPYVMLNERYSDVDAPVLRIDDELGGYLAAQHLLELGHTQIAGFFKTDDFQGVHRMRGFLRALREHRMAVQPDNLVRYTTEEKYTRPQSMLADMLDREHAQRPTAVICYNDELAVLMLDVIRRSGLQVPEHLSIVGFDDSSLATATEVKLTTLTHPKSEMGADAVDMLMKLAQRQPGERIMPDKIYAPSLVVRESTQPPRQPMQL